jgi:hypothetical protein
MLGARKCLVYTPINWHLTPEIAHFGEQHCHIVSEHVHPALEIISRNLRAL